MDLLGSILNSMEKPPEIDEKRKEEIKSWCPSLLCVSYSHFVYIYFAHYFFHRTERAIRETAGV